MCTFIYARIHQTNAEGPSLLPLLIGLINHHSLNHLDQLPGEYTAQLQLFSGFVCLIIFLKEKKYPPRNETSSLYCVQTLSFLFVGMLRVCKSSKIKHPGCLSGLCPLDQREPEVRYPFFRIFTFVKSHL